MGFRPIKSAFRDCPFNFFSFNNGLHVRDAAARLRETVLYLCICTLLKSRKLSVCLFPQNAQLPYSVSEDENEAMGDT